MSYLALYRKWRPLLFEDIVEQEAIVKTLKHSVSSGKISHAYLFCGTRGTGKTTTAKILSRAVNCLSLNDGNPCNTCSLCRETLSGSNLDIIEMDAASNNSVDNVRNIRDEVIYAPSHSKYKVYIIDEVHMLSTGAFNALLKTLEEPPSHVIFILATTEPHKLPATILSRCQRYDFKRISSQGTMGQLQKISADNNITLEDSAALLIANLSDGALRDAISLLDQCMSLGNSTISYDDVLSIIGLVRSDFMENLVDSILDKNMPAIFTAIEELSVNGNDFKQFVSDLVKYLRNLLILSIASNTIQLDLPTSTLEKMKQQLPKISNSELVRYVKELSLLESNLRWAISPRVLLEISLIRLTEGHFSDSLDALENKVEMLEKKIASGIFTAENSVTSTSKTAPPKPQSDKPAAKSISNAEITIKPDTRQLSIWKEVLEELRLCGKVMLYTCLLNAKALDLENVIGIVFEPGSSFNRTTVLKSENVTFLKDVIEKRLGRQIQIKCFDSEDVDPLNPESLKNDVIKKAENAAKAFNVPLNIIDE